MKTSVFTMLCLICCAISCSAADISISDAKKLPDVPVSSVSLSSKIVTYTAADYFYIEEDNRSIGIRVEKTAHGLTVGMRVDISGIMKTNTNKERYILATSATQTPAPNSTGTVLPIGMNNNTLGGGNWNVVGTGGQRGISEAIGLNNIGLLVKTWGKYKQIDSTNFTIDDGAGLNIKCTVPMGTFLYSGWQYVNVTGISSMYKPNSSSYWPNILAQDINVVSPVEAVSIPGTPSGNVNPSINVSETYTTTGSTCSQGHTVEYSFNWGDGTSSPWSTSNTASHSWNTLGAKTINVNARCLTHINIYTSSDGLAVNVNDGPCEMIYILAGSFLMGNSSVGADATYLKSSELPQHSVSLAAYSIGKYEVTRGQYRQFMNAGGYSNSAYWSTDGWSWKVSNSRTEPYYWAASQDWMGVQPFTQTDNHPVVGVSYYEAEAFCSWAGGHLPTEAQWERAARWTGNHANVYPWGDTWNNEYCNNYYDSNAAGGGYGKYQTTPVGSYSNYGSPSGCQDMAGNVWKWCQDWYKAYPGSSIPFDYTNSYRVVRGGGWIGDGYYASDTRCAYRYDGYSYPSSYSCSTGFRLAR